MKFLVRYSNDRDKYSIIEKPSFPAALAYAKMFRKDVLVFRMDEKCLTHNELFRLTKEFRIEDIAVKTVWELHYKEMEEHKIRSIECCEFQLEKEVNKAMSEVHGKLFTLDGVRFLSKRKAGKNVPICIIYEKGQKKKHLMLE